MGSPGKRSAEKSRDWSCGSVSGIMVVWWEGVPNAILEVMMLTVSKVFCVAHGHLLTAVPTGAGDGGREGEKQRQKGLKKRKKCSGFPKATHQETDF